MISRVQFGAIQSVPNPDHCQCEPALSLVQAVPCHLTLVPTEYAVSGSDTALFLQAMEGSMLTISLGIWMELPGVNYRDMCPSKRR